MLNRSASLAMSTSVLKALPDKLDIKRHYNPFLVYCRELAPGTVSLTGDRAQGDDNKHDSHYNLVFSM